MKRALVLSGGGSKGAFEVGAIAHLINKKKLDFQLFTGTSVGALNAAFLGQARNHQELQELAEELTGLWLGIRGSRCIYRGGLFGSLWRFFWRGVCITPWALGFNQPPNRPGAPLSPANRRQSNGRSFETESFCVLIVASRRSTRLSCLCSSQRQYALFLPAFPSAASIGTTEVYAI